MKRLTVTTTAAAAIFALIAVIAGPSLVRGSDPSYGPKVHGEGPDTWTVESGGTAQIESGGVFSAKSGSNTNLSGAVNISGALAISGATTINANQSVSSGKTLTIASGGALTASSGATVTAASGSTTNLSGTTTIDGAATVASGGSVTVASGGTLTINSGGTVSAAAGSAIAVAGKFTLPTATVNTTGSVAASDSGKHIIATAEDITLTLPAAASGLFYTFHVGNVAGGTGLTIHPPSPAKVHGNGLTATGAKGLLCTHGTARDGDFVSLYCDGTDWWIFSINGTWAQEP